MTSSSLGALTLSGSLTYATGYTGGQPWQSHALAPSEGVLIVSPNQIFARLRVADLESAYLLHIRDSQRKWSTTPVADTPTMDWVSSDRAYPEQHGFPCRLFTISRDRHGQVYLYGSVKS
ncbi:hypothetical protein F5Y12DRAFT_713431 [Xylaria sp. FL1777]|nr:hypothetical protein F5Y12DRAFT_713431 [Xylaria sp. FL1777]